jgi:Putative prokaryotic signal transducing protein
MVKLMTADDAFGAKVVAAKLGVEGIVWQLKGGVDGPYPFGPVHVFVTAEDLEAAKAVLAAAEPLDDDDDPDDAEPVGLRSRRSDRRALLVGGAIVGVLALAAAELVRMLAPG